jgi:hypothetical protein
MKMNYTSIPSGQTGGNSRLGPFQTDQSQGHLSVFMKMKNASIPIGQKGGKFPPKPF